VSTDVSEEYIASIFRVEEILSARKQVIMEAIISVHLLGYISDLMHSKK
jgi:hypothetical protein